MKYSRLVSAFLRTPWAIWPPKLAEMQAFLRLAADGGKIKKKEVAAIVAGRRPMDVTMAGRVAMLPVFGVISQRVGALEEASGGVSTEKLGATLDSLVADRQVKCVLMVFDSPGGSVFGIQELGEKIRGYRGEKKVAAIADSMAASAAYWLASQAQEFYVTPGGQVGSIGVLAAHEDYSQLLETMGVKTTLVSAGKFKVEGNPYEPLGEEARAEIQSKVDGYYEAFLDAVAKGRNTSTARVKNDFGQGRMLMAAQAKDVGMVDRVATLEKTLHLLGAGSDGQAAVAALKMVTPQAAAARARSLEVGNG
jgi:capsid assembly protease